MDSNFSSLNVSNPFSHSRQPLVESPSQNTRSQENLSQDEGTQVDPSQNERMDTVSKDATVLVVEDNVSNFVLIARMLGYMGIHCEWKTSGYEVVEYADTLPRLDLILLDIRLPYEDGFSALKKIRASSNLKNTLVVAVTAEASKEHMKKAQEAGFDGFLGKPLDPDRFPDQVRHILGREPVWELS